MTPSSVLIGRFLAAEIGAFLTSLFVGAVASDWSAVVRIWLLLLCFLIKGNQASGISIPLSLLMLLGCSLMYISSFTQLVLQ